MDTDVPPILLPCAICARTFMPQSLEKHSRICERSSSKKRKPFDSAKQRIQGTELAEFLPRQERSKRRRSPDDKSSKPGSTWKQTHDDFLRAIRAARNEIVDSTMQKQCGTTITPNAPTRANEQGTCPTCSRHFGVKAYDRHVAWCKERINRVPVSTATNIAKERLEARMKYRAPAVKSRRQATRVKYSPGSAAALTSGSKTSPTTLRANKAKESVSAPSCNRSNDSPVKQANRSTVVRRPSQTKESSSPTVPTKSQTADRINRLLEDETAGPATSRPAPPVKTTSPALFPPLKRKKETHVDECNSVATPRSSKRQPRRTPVRVKQEDERTHQPMLHSARSFKANIVSARSQGNPRLNDVSINDDIVGVTVKPCSIRRESQLVTWKQLMEADQAKKSPKESVEFVLNVDSKEERGSEGTTVPATLNETYSFIKDSTTRSDKIDDLHARHARKKKWKPVRHSPRVEFCFGDSDKASLVNSVLSGKAIGKNCRGSLKGDSFETNDAARFRGEENSRFASSRVKSLSGSFQSTRSRIFEKKRLSAINSHSDFEIARNSPRSLREDFQTVNASGSIDATGNLPSSSPNKQLPRFDEFSNLDGNKSQKRTNEITDSNMEEANDEPNTDSHERVKAAEKDADELNISRENSIRSLRDEHFVKSGNDRNDAFYNLGNSDSNWIEMETDPFDADTMLQPTRSSTPFVNIENCSWGSKCEEDENLTKELQPLPGDHDWKEKIDARTGSEMLYRVESSDSHCLDTTRRSSRGAMDKFEGIANFEIASSNGNRRDECEILPRISSPMEQTGREASPRDASSSLSKRRDESSSEMRATLPETQRKEIASQINICNCPLKFSSNVKRADVSGNTWERSKTPVCVTCCSNVEIGELYVAEKSSEALGETNFDEGNFNGNVTESSASQLNANLGRNDCKRGCTIVKDNNDSNVMAKRDEEVREIYKNYPADGFDCDSDNSVECHAQDDANRLKSSSNRGDEAAKQNQRRLRSIVLSESCFKLCQRVRLDDSSTNRSAALRSRRSRIVEIENRIRENMSALNESSDSLASSVEQVESVEVETIEEIGTRNRSIRFRILPEIKGRVTMRNSRDDGEEIGEQTYWEKATRASRNRLINLDPPCQGASRFLKRNPKFRILPPVPSNSSLTNHRDIKLPLRPVWSNYVRRRPDFNLVLSGRTGKDYDPFLLAEQQMNDLLSDTSEQSVTDGPASIVDQSRDSSSFPLSHSSAFVKYPCQPPLANPEKRSSLIAPPTEFDDLTSDFSSDSTETNSLSREVFLKDLKGNGELKDSIAKEKKSPARELGRRVIIDKSKALGGDVIEDGSRGSRSFVASTERARRILDKVSPKVVRPSVSRSLSVRASSAPKTTPDRTTDNSNENPHEKRFAFRKGNDARRSSNKSLNNNYANLSSSNLSLSSIISSDVDIKRSNSVFDELMTTFENENGPFPSLKSFLKTDSLSVSSPVHGAAQRNGQVSDEELSSPDSYKRQDHNKMSADSAYSSLNRKYSHHGRTNDVAGRGYDLEDLSRSNRQHGDGVASKCKMSKYCHRCGFKFPETAKFCCECGIRRLVL
ncbi:hypothetical protein E2986_06931 [Frieseomelitta varia]|uniref:C2HC/C3H-type domain-containing protein n=1 Tax=Frieseomelitta varia TaxID=561572 RepID=A0A833S8Z8_9HYME|nr:hypothetical protein E2986_06931 [Frieseomelitta varia]